LLGEGISRKMIAYMITWTTYGSWLQGDERGYVKNGTILDANENLKRANQEQQKFPTVKLNANQKQIAKNVIEQEAKRIDHKIHALAICSNHVHIILQKANEPIESIVARYKNKSTHALKAEGFEGKIWTRGYNKKFLYNIDKLKSTIQYVQNHNNG